MNFFYNKYLLHKINIFNTYSTCYLSAFLNQKKLIWPWFVNAHQCVTVSANAQTIKLTSYSDNICKSLYGLRYLIWLDLAKPRELYRTPKSPLSCAESTKFPGAESALHWIHLDKWIRRISSSGCLVKTSENWTI